MASFAARVTGLGFAAISRLSPRTAGWLAFRLFCRTPPKRPKAGKALDALREGTALLAHAERWRLDIPGGHVAAYRLAGRDRRAPKIMVVHGWGSRAEYLARLARDLHATGAEVVMLDLPGHGRSDGRILHLKLAADAISTVGNVFGPFDGAVGHSFGGASLMVAAGGAFPDVPSFTVGRIALIGAPTEIESLFKMVSRKLRLTPPAAQNLIQRAEAVGRVRLAMLDTVPIAERLAIPMLVVHAEDDKEVGPHHARRYETVGGALKFLWANGLGHRRIVSAEPVISGIAQFFSGAAEAAA